MISRIYIDNFLCFVNFEIHLDSLNLFLGANGSGKSSVFNLLHRLQRLIDDGDPVDRLFPTDTLTRWENRSDQTVELEFLLGEDVYVYRLTIEHNRDRRKRRIKAETLDCNGKPLFRFLEGTAHLFRDDHSVGPEYPFDWSRSGIPTLPARHDNTRITRFRREIGRMVFLSLNPRDLDPTSIDESPRLHPSGANFVSWYEYLSHEHQGNVINLTNKLREVLEGFDHIDLKNAGERTKEFIVRMEVEDKGSIKLSFGELSDGQRALIILYTLLFGLKNEGYSLFLDEPENFVSLREIQPWQSELLGLCGDGIEQAVIVSHHPEILNMLAETKGRWFSRIQNGPVRVSERPSNQVDGLTIAETIARGWEE